MRNLSYTQYLLSVLIACLTFIAPVSAQSLDHIIRSSSDAVVQANISQISNDIDEHNAPVDIVTLLITEVIVGEIDNNIIQLSVKVDVNYDGPPVPKFEQGEEMILCLKQVVGDWIILGNSLGKFRVTGTTVEESTISVEQFKDQIRAVVMSTTTHIDWPLPPQIPRGMKMTAL